MTAQLQIDDVQREAVDKTARFLVRIGMTVPAVLAIESIRPLSFMGSQFMHLLSPSVGTILAPNSWDAIAKLLEEREGMDYFLQRIEEIDAEEKNK